MAEAKPRTTRKPAAATQAAAAPAPKAAKAKATAATPRAPARPKKAGVDADLRQKLIIETAYYLSEKRRGHCSELDDWLFSETLVDSLIRELR